jgi:anthranilate synthase component I
MSTLSFAEFKRLSSQGNLIPIVAKFNADTETPVSAFLKMTQGPYRFLYESMEGGEKWGRYSFLGSEPSLVLRSLEDRTEILRGKNIEYHQGNPLDLIQDLLAQYHPVLSVEVPRLAGGFVGYLGYDMVRFMESLPDLEKPGLPVYDSVMMLQDSIIAFDNLSHQLEIVVMAHVDGKQRLQKVYEQALRKVDTLAKRLKQPLPALKSLKKKTAIHPKSNTTEKQFHEMVKRAREYMRAGDIFQVVLSQRWEANFKRSPFQVYRELRQINPSPYLFYLEMGDQCLAGSSPEVMVRLEGSKITLRPIAGTRRRGRNPEDEIKMENEMIHDPKEIAEHIMLVDLGRNDVGRVSQKGTVKVTELMQVEKYSHVMHIVSNVEGQLLSGLGAMDVLKATFPAGTLSGAPKIRAMEIIEELEVGRRGPYGGAVGYFDFYGNMDTAITIRSLVFAKGKVWLQSGGGIVLDSRPELEYLESNNKAKVMMEALKRCS